MKNLKYKGIFVFLFSMMFLGCNNDFVKGSQDKLDELIPKPPYPFVQWVGGSNQDLYIHPSSDLSTNAGVVSKIFYANLVTDIFQLQFGPIGGISAGTDASDAYLFTLLGGTGAAPVSPAGAITSNTSVAFNFAQNDLGSASIGKSMQISLKPVIFQGRDKEKVKNSDLTVTVKLPDYAEYTKYVLENKLFDDITLDLDNPPAPFTVLPADAYTALDTEINTAIDAALSAENLDTINDATTVGLLSYAPIVNRMHWTPPTIPLTSVGEVQPSWAGSPKLGEVAPNYTIRVEITYHKDADTSVNPNVPAVDKRATAEVVMGVKLLHTPGTGGTP